MPTLPNTAQDDAAGRNAASLRALVQSSGLSQVVWCGNELGSQSVETVSSGWTELDKELPGSGWPRRSVTEVLTAQPSVVEWGPSSKQVARSLSLDRRATRTSLA